MILVWLVGMILAVLLVAMALIYCVREGVRLGLKDYYEKRP